MIALEPHTDGVILRVRVQPGAQHDRVRGAHNGSLKVSVTAAPEKGKANRAVLKLLSKALDVRRGQLILIEGETSRDKRILIRGAGPDEMSQRLNQLLSVTK